METSPTGEGYRGGVHELYKRKNLKKPLRFHEKIKEGSRGSRACYLCLLITGMAALKAAKIIGKRM
jgi:hypothetical protein